MAEASPEPTPAVADDDTDRPADVVTPADPVERVVVRRSPRYSVFFMFGAVFGIFIAMVLTFTFDSTGVVGTAGVTYSQTQVFGFLALICGTLGLVLAGALALVLDRTGSRRAHEVSAAHARIQSQD